MGTRGRAVLGVGVIALLVTLAFADDDSDRASLLARIQTKLESAARALVTPDVESATDSVKEVEQLAGELYRVKGSDATAERVASSYPGYARAFYPAAAELKKLKLRQLTKGDLEAQCKALDAELVQKVAAMKDDPDAVAELTEAARAFGAKAESVMASGASQALEVRAGESAVKYFSVSEGAWDDVTDNLHRAAEAIVADWQTAYEKAKASCESLLRKESHPAVERALAKLASSTAGRKQLHESVTKAIDQLAARIAAVPGASDTSSVDAVGEQLGAVDAALSTLAQARGDDAKTKELTERWQSVAREARNPLAPLRQLKLHHHVLDELPAKCDEMESKLDAFIAAHDDDADGIEKIPVYAEELGNPVMVGMGKAKERQTQMRADRDSVASFASSDGPWAAVATAYSAAATAMRDYYDAGITKLESRCGNITLTRKHPKVLAAIARLGRKTNTQGDQLDADVERWVDAARATYRLDCDGMKKIYDSYCAVDWEPNEGDDATPQGVASSVQQSMKAAMSPLLGELPALDRRISVLVAKNQTRARGERLAAKLQKQRVRLEKLSEQDVWKGNFGLLKQFSQEFGKASHRSLHSSYGCAVPVGADAVADFPGTGHTKPDCLVPSTCKVWEFKPNSARGHAEGPRQVVSYEYLVAPYYTAHYRNKTTPPTSLGGQTVMDQLVKSCLRGDEISLEVAAYYYNKCEVAYQCIED